jgi:polyisoprenyl-teichoic acid--peptidoglycan teichoic acid transferase
VGGVLGEVVAGGAVVDVRVPDQTELLQCLEGAVDRGGRHCATAVGGHRLDDVVGSGVTEPADGGQHPLALRRQALALRPQPLAQISHPTNYASQRTPRLRTYTGRVTEQSLEPRDAGISDREHPGITEERGTRRKVKRALIVLTALILVLVAGVAGFVGYLGYTVNDNVTHEALLPENRPPVTAPDGSPVAETGSGTNFLVVGADTRPGDAGRSDVMVLVHIPQDGKTVSMIHFPRDLYVDVPGHGKDKINAAYAYGREPLLVQTMENLLKIRIHHVAKTNFEGFKAMTDAVGGVRVYAEEASSGSGDGGPVVIQEGWNNLNGEEALAFVRERHALSEGDISRGRRQLAFIKALMLKAISPATVTNPLKIAKFTDAATENLVLDQDLTISQLRDYAVSLRNIRGSDVVFSTAPFTGFGTSPGGASIDIVDTKGMADLGEALRTDTMDSYGDVFVTP